MFSSVGAAVLSSTWKTGAAVVLTPVSQAGAPRPLLAADATTPAVKRIRASVTGLKREKVIQIVSRFLAGHELVGDEDYLHWPKQASITQGRIFSEVIPAHEGFALSRWPGFILH